MRVPVAIVEDKSDIRLALEKIIEISDRFEVACSCVNGEEALWRIPSCKPAIVLMDINLGGINGIECVRTLKQQFPEMLFMMCTVYEDDEKIFQALTAGANGYVLKKTTPAKMIEALRELLEGGAPMTSQIARKVVAAFQHQPIPVPNTQEPAAATREMLSKRENEILEMLSKGLLYKEIADALFISAETVRKHVYHIYEKLHVSNRVEAVNKYFGR